GATLIYNQAKVSAGNSRGQEKVVALQQLIEEYAAQNQGVYPSNVSDVATLWTRKRPDDWNKSPWGGVIGASYNPTAATGTGVGTDAAGTTTLGTLATMPQYATTTAVAANEPTTANAGVTAYTTTDANYIGGLVYDYDSSNATFSFAEDLITNNPVMVRGYAVYIADQQGRMPNFTTGGKANQ
ncbi:MAG: hypothetical protein KGR26_09755, partial [Cyanobacteria bacterium REEB65]|nr:hypothetical protein [Cyanobacteria bacterium REEB65]